MMMMLPTAQRLLFLIACFSVATLPLISQESSDSAGDGGQVSSSYVISPLDYLRIALYVADEMQFQTEVRVSQSGSVTVPHLGTVRLSGKSIEEVRDELYEPYNRDYYVNPHIEVIVLSYAERSVTVIGKVNRQGLVPFPSEEGLTLLEAIALAGGWSADRLADKRNVTITRRGEDGEKFTIEVDARNLTTKDYQLQEGDVVNIPERIW
jgi:protein involved in polysaccharide export with SLBB domain